MNGLKCVRGAIEWAKADWRGSALDEIEVPPEGLRNASKVALYLIRRSVSLVTNRDLNRQSHAKPDDSAGHSDSHLLDRSEHLQANCECVTFDFACIQDQHSIGVRKSQ